MIDGVTVAQVAVELGAQTSTSNLTAGKGALTATDIVQQAPSDAPAAVMFGKAFPWPPS